MIKLFEEKQKKFFEDTLQNRCSWKFSNIHRKNICVESIFKKRLQHRYFPENFAKCLRTPFLQNSSGPFIKTTENYLENLFSKNGGSWKQEMCKYNDKRKKTQVICDSHLARTETRKRKKNTEKNFVAFKIFWGANTK